MRSNTSVNSSDVQLRGETLSPPGQKKSENLWIKCIPSRVNTQMRQNATETKKGHNSTCAQNWEIVWDWVANALALNPRICEQYIQLNKAT